MDLPDIAFFRLLARAVAEETLPLFRGATGIDNKLSDGFDPVTEADRNAEKAIRAIIEKHYPDHAILGEEYGLTKGDGVHQWVIDPIDGTRAFISGLPVWGTLVGLTVHGVARCGMMYQPYTDELYVADGIGSWLVERGGEKQRLETRRDAALETAIMMTTDPTLYDQDSTPAFERLRDAVRLTRYGCDCYAFAMLAAGHIDIVIEPGLQSYDIVGLIPVIEQAGGLVTRWDGARAEQGGHAIAAATPQLHKAALDLLSSV